MTLTRILCSALFAALAPGLAGAQTIEVSKLHENLRLAANVSGDIVVGFHYDTSVEGASLPQLNADLLTDWKDKRTCLRFVSDDGLYEAAYEVSFPGLNTSRHAAIPLEKAEKKKFLRKFPADSMAVTFGTMSANGCSGVLQRVAAVAWNRSLSPESSAGYVLKVNSRNADEVYIVFPDGRDVTCEKRDTPQRVAFDHICRIEASWLKEGNPSEIEINQIRRGSFDPPVYLTLTAIR